MTSFIRWVYHDKAQHQGYIADLLQETHMPMLTPWLLENQLKVPCLILTIALTNVQYLYDIQLFTRWVYHDKPQRRGYIADLLQETRMPLLSPRFLVDRVEAEDLIKQDLKCRDLLDEAKNYHMLPDRRTSMRKTQITPRKSTIGKFTLWLNTVQGEFRWNDNMCLKP